MDAPKTIAAAILAQLDAIQEKVFYAVAVEGDTAQQAKDRLSTEELDLAFSVTEDNFDAEDMEDIVWAKQDIYDTLHKA